MNPEIGVLQARLVNLSTKGEFDERVYADADRPSARDLFEYDIVKLTDANSNKRTRPRASAYMSAPRAQRKGISISDRARAAARLAGVKNRAGNVVQVYGSEHTGAARLDAHGKYFWKRLDSLQTQLESQEPNSSRYDAIIEKAKKLFDNPYHVRLFLDSGDWPGTPAKCKVGYRANEELVTRLDEIYSKIKDAIYAKCTRNGVNKRIDTGTPMRLSKPKTVKSGPTNLKRGAKRAHSLDQTFARKVATAKHKLTRAIVGKKYATKKNQAMRSVVSSAKRSCKRRDFKTQTGVMVCSTRHAGALANVSEERLHAMLDKMKDKLEPQVYEAVLAWIKKDTRALNHAYSKRSGDQRSLRPYPHLSVHLSPTANIPTISGHGVQVSFTYAYAHRAAAYILALIDVAQKYEPKKKLNARYYIDVQNYADDAKIDKVNAGMAAWFLEDRVGQWDYRHNYALEMLLSLRAVDKKKTTLSFVDVRNLVKRASTKVAKYEKDIEKVAEFLNESPFAVVTMLAYLPVPVQGSWLTHTHEWFGPRARKSPRAAACGNAEDARYGRRCDSGRGTGSTRSRSCGGTMYFQKLPSSYLEKGIVNSDENAVGRPSADKKVNGVAQALEGRTSAAPPDVFRALYYTFAKRPAYTARLVVSSPDGVMSPAWPGGQAWEDQSIAFAKDEARKPLKGNPATYIDSLKAMTAYWKFIVFLTSTPKQARIVRLLHKDFRTDAQAPCVRGGNEKNENDDDNDNRMNNLNKEERNIHQGNFNAPPSNPPSRAPPPSRSRSRSIASMGSNGNVNTANAPPVPPPRAAARRARNNMSANSNNLNGNFNKLVNNFYG